VRVRRDLLAEVGEAPSVLVEAEPEALVECWNAKPR
jgi:hypothetical protein